MITLLLLITAMAAKFLWDKLFALPDKWQKKIDAKIDDYIDNL